MDKEMQEEVDKRRHTNCKSNCWMAFVVMTFVIALLSLALSTYIFTSNLLHNNRLHQSVIAGERHKKLEEVRHYLLMLYSYSYSRLPVTLTLTEVNVKYLDAPPSTILLVLTSSAVNVHYNILLCSVQFHQLT